MTKKERETQKEHQEERKKQMKQSMGVGPQVKRAEQEARQLMGQQRTEAAKQVTTII